MIVAGVGNTSGNTYNTSNSRRDSEPVQADDLDHSYPRRERLCHLEVEAEIVVQSPSNSPRPNPKANAESNGPSKDGGEMGGGAGNPGRKYVLQ